MGFPEHSVSTFSSFNNFRGHHFTVYYTFFKCAYSCNICIYEWPIWCWFPIRNYNCSVSCFLFHFLYAFLSYRRWRNNPINTWYLSRLAINTAKTLQLLSDYISKHGKKYLYNGLRRYLILIGILTIHS